MKINRMRIALICGMLGCLCYGGGDWLMLYGNPAHHGTLSWLTEGVAAMPPWRFNLAMALAFPGIILYGIALFAVQGFITGEKQRKIYHFLNAFGLTPWIALHLFYIMILSLFAWLNRNGFAGDATAICEGLYAPLAWLVPVSEGLMLPVFVWWFWLQINGRTVFPRWMAFTNVLIIYGVLKGVSLLMPESAFRLGFTNGLMSESMIVWFGFMLVKGESGYGESLPEFYRRTQTSPSLEASLPEDMGDGSIARICTPRGVSLSTWEMRYHRDTPVEGVVGNEFRLLFCLGEGVEWQNDSERILCVRPSHACLCMGDGSTERMCYGSGYGHPFHQVSIARGQAMSMIQGNYDKALAYLTSLARPTMWVDIDVAIEVIYS